MVPETTLTREFRRFEPSCVSRLRRTLSLSLFLPRVLRLLIVRANGHSRAPSLYPKSMNPYGGGTVVSPASRKSGSEFLTEIGMERIYCCLAIDAGTSFPRWKYSRRGNFPGYRRMFRKFRKFIAPGPAALMPSSSRFFPSLPPSLFLSSSLFLCPLHFFPVAPYFSARGNNCGRAEIPVLFRRVKRFYRVVYHRFKNRPAAPPVFVPSRGRRQYNSRCRASSMIASARVHDAYQPTSVSEVLSFDAITFALKERKGGRKEE